MSAPGEDPAERLLALYGAFNDRDIDGALAGMAPDVAWPNGWEGGHVHGHEAVRDYWTRQWAAIDPHVEPVEISVEPDGRVAVLVRPGRPRPLRQPSWPRAASCTPTGSPAGWSPRWRSASPPGRPGSAGRRLRGVIAAGGRRRPAGRSASASLDLRDEAARLGEGDVVGHARARAPRRGPARSSRCRFASPPLYAASARSRSP